MTLKLGIPSKGRLMEKSARWFAERGVEIALTGAAREYAGAVRGVEGVDLVLLPAAEVPRELAAGRLHLGVTGRDMVEEKLAFWDEGVAPLAELGFGHADLMIAVPDFWVDVETLDDLDGAAAAFRARHGQRLRIATKYHRLVRAFLREAGVADYALVDSQGATEGTVKNLQAEAIADISTTGATLRDNHLRPLQDGTILKSQAGLFRSLVAEWTAEDRARLGTLLEKLGLS